MKIRFNDLKNVLSVMYDYIGMDSSEYGFEDMLNDFEEIKEQHSKFPDCWEVQIFVPIPTNVKECQDYTAFLRNINILVNWNEFRCLCVGVYANSGEHLAEF